MLKPERIENVVLAACCLHNLIRQKNPATTEFNSEDPTTHDLIPALWRGDQTLPQLPSLPRGQRSTLSAKAQRLLLKDYFVSPAGSVPWQLSKI